MVEWMDEEMSPRIITLARHTSLTSANEILDLRKIKKTSYVLPCEYHCCCTWMTNSTRIFHLQQKFLNIKISSKKNFNNKNNNNYYYYYYYYNM